MQNGTSNQVVFVKFATRYREYVHRMHVGVIGDICMVIVEYSQRRGTSRSSSDLAPWFMAHFYRLRENLLHMPEDLLVDFDGVSRDGENRYSACLDPTARFGVNRWQIMKRERDDGNLKQLSGGYLDRKPFYAPSTTKVSEKIVGPRCNIRLYSSKTRPDVESSLKFHWQTRVIFLFEHGHTHSYDHRTGDGDTSDADTGAHCMTKCIAGKGWRAAALMNVGPLLLLTLANNLRVSDCNPRARVVRGRCYLENAG